MKNALVIFEFLAAAIARGEKTALVTITDVVGGSARAPGTHLAVSETGAYIGSLSGGCIEAAVAAEAQQAIAAKQAKTIRFGLGAPFMDIRLPCGGGIDLLISPNLPAETILAARRGLAERKAISLALTKAGQVTLRGGVTLADGWQGHVFVARHQPGLRLVILGAGAETFALARIGAAYGADIAILSPDDATRREACRHGLQSWDIPLRGGSPDLITDPWSAVVFLFHDHDREMDLLAQALNQAAMFIGAMGSRTTHARRVEALLARGIAPAKVASIVGPVGLIPATRDPETLAISILSQVVMRYEEYISSWPEQPNIVFLAVPKRWRKPSWPDAGQDAGKQSRCPLSRA